jgi:hypothetical protein
VRALASSMSVFPVSRARAEGRAAQDQLRFEILPTEGEITVLNAGYKRERGEIAR